MIPFYRFLDPDEEDLPVEEAFEDELLSCEAELPDFEDEELLCTLPEDREGEELLCTLPEDREGEELLCMLLPDDRVGTEDLLTEELE